MNLRGYMFYYKTKNGKKFKKVNAPSKDKAREILEALEIYTDEIYTEEEKQALEEEMREKTPEELFQSLPEVSKNIWRKICSFNGNESDDVLIYEDQIERFNLIKNVEKPYYVFIEEETYVDYKPYKGFGFFLNKEEVIKFVKNELENYRLWNYDTWVIYDVTNLKSAIKIKTHEQYYLNGELVLEKFY